MSKKDRNTYSLEEINKIDLGDRIEVTNRATGVTSVVKTASKAEISAVVAYLIGVNEDKWAGYYEFNYADLYKKLTDDNEATAIRYLCRIRTVFFKKFLEIENELSLLKSIDEIGYFQKEEVEKLVAMGISPIRYNCHAQDYVIYISELIEKHIDNCAKWFPKFVKWEYIRDLFVIPKKKDMKKSVCSGVQ